MEQRAKSREQRAAGREQAESREAAIAGFAVAISASEQ
jgi:hypothetical protein